MKKPVPSCDLTNEGDQRKTSVCQDCVRQRLLLRDYLNITAGISHQINYNYGMNISYHLNEVRLHIFPHTQTHNQNSQQYEEPKSEVSLASVYIL